MQTDQGPERPDVWQDDAGQGEITKALREDAKRRETTNRAPTKEEVQREMDRRKGELFEQGDHLPDGSIRPHKVAWNRQGSAVIVSDGMLVCLHMRLGQDDHMAVRDMMVKNPHTILGLLDALHAHAAYVLSHDLDLTAQE